MFKRILAVFIFTGSVFSQTDIFVLCEGNFGQANATLWGFDDSFGEMSGPIYQNLTGNPLGDVAQSMAFHNDKLYIIVNNSHTVEVLDLDTGIEYETTIDVPEASPREMETVGDLGYLTCWHLNGIIVLDLVNNTIIDTILVDGLPEDIVYHNDKLYTSITMNPDWSSGNQVLEIEPDWAGPIITNSFEVVPGPGQMLVHDGQLYVASTYYDASWNTYSGTSRIDLATGEVTTADYGMTNSYGTDLTEFQGAVYRTYATGIAPLTDSLTVDESGLIGNLLGVYSMASYGDYIYFGLSDYIAPDEVVVLNSAGEQIVSYQVGAIPGSFAFHSTGSTAVEEFATHPLTFSLLQNYPNPFNPTTTIKFALSQPTEARFTIYDLAGREVMVLTNGPHMSGSYTLVWDASGLSSGFYLGVLSVNGQSAALKMTLVR